MANESLILDLRYFSAVEFNQESGNSPPIDINLRHIIRYPQLISHIAETLITFLPPSTHYDVVCGVSQVALRIADSVAYAKSTPMLMSREEIEGVFEPNDKCLIIIDDLVASGGSVLETAKWMRAGGLVVTDAVALIDREEGGREDLEKNGIKLHSMIKLSDMARVLKGEGKVLEENEVTEFLTSRFFLFVVCLILHCCYIFFAGFDGFAYFSTALLELFVIFTFLSYVWTSCFAPRLKRTLPPLELGWNWKHYSLVALASCIVAYFAVFYLIYLLLGVILLPLQVGFCYGFEPVLLDQNLTLAARVIQTQQRKSDDSFFNKISFLCNKGKKD